MDNFLLWVPSVFTIILVMWVLLFRINAQKAAFVCSTVDPFGVIQQVALVQGPRFLQYLSQLGVLYLGNGCGNISAKINLICSICICHTIRIIVPSSAISLLFPLNFQPNNK